MTICQAKDLKRKKEDKLRSCCVIKEKMNNDEKERIFKMATEIYVCFIIIFSSYQMTVILISLIIIFQHMIHSLNV